MIPTPSEVALALSQSVEVSLLSKATALLLIGLTAVAAARRTRASVRHLLLAATFAGLMATPIIGIAVPATTIAIPVAPVVAPTATTPAAAPALAAPAGTTTAATAVTTAWRVSGRIALQLVWSIGTLLFLAPLGAMLWRLRSLRRTSVPWPELADSVATLASERGVQPRIDVLSHEDVPAPITFGVWRPVILMPIGAAEWTEGDRRRALVHEIEHVRRGDWMVHIAARIASAAYWFHPLAWVAWRKLVLEAERACDDAVVAHEERTDYADQLVTLAKRLSAAPGQALGMAHRSDLAARVAAVLDDTRPRGRAGLATATMTIAGAIVLVLGLAPLRAVAVTSESSGDRAAISIPASYARDGKVIIDGQQMSVDSAIDVVRRTGAKRINLRGDRQTQLRQLTDIMERLKQAGVQQVVLAEQPARVPRLTRALDRELLEAAESGDLDGVRELLDAGANVDAAIDGDGSPLIAASRRSHLEIAVELLNRGADVNFAVSGDGNPLIAAAAAGAVDVVELLLARGAAIDLMVEGDENALIQAAGAGHLAIVRLLVARGADVNARVYASTWKDGARSGEWRSPLRQAHQNGHRAIVAFLLQAGARE